MPSNYGYLLIALAIVFPPILFALNYDDFEDRIKDESDICFKEEPDNISVENESNDITEKMKSNEIDVENGPNNKKDMDSILVYYNFI